MIIQFYNLNVQKLRRNKTTPVKILKFIKSTLYTLYSEPLKYYHNRKHIYFLANYILLLNNLKTFLLQRQG